MTAFLAVAGLFLFVRDLTFILGIRVQYQLKQRRQKGFKPSWLNHVVLFHYFEQLLRSTILFSKQ